MIPVIQRARILIVDDEPTILSALRRMLRHHGFDSVETFDDGEAATDRHHARAFDLALLDVEMSGMSGVDIASRLRTVDVLLPVIFLTADATGPLASRASCVSTTLIEKPWDATELIAAVEQHLLARKSPRGIDSGQE